MSTKKLLLRPVAEKLFVSISNPLFADGSQSLERFFPGLLFRSFSSFSTGDSATSMHASPSLESDLQRGGAPTPVRKPFGVERIPRSSTICDSENGPSRIRIFLVRSACEGRYRNSEKCPRLVTSPRQVSENESCIFRALLDINVPYTTRRDFCACA